MPTTHKLDAQQVHHEWNNALAPRLTIDPGDTVVFDTRDASDRYYSRKSTHPDVHGARPVPWPSPHRAGRGARRCSRVTRWWSRSSRCGRRWTSAGPRSVRAAGCCPRPTSRSPSCRSGTSDGTHARAGKRVAVPIEPFPGVMGAALDEPGGHSTMPPRKNGGNMDIKQLTAGSTLYLPVWVDGRAVLRGRRPRRPGRRRGVRHRRRDERPGHARFGLAARPALAEPQLRTTRPPSADRRARARGSPPPRTAPTSSRPPSRRSAT